MIQTIKTLIIASGICLLAIGNPLAAQNRESESENFEYFSEHETASFSFGGGIVSNEKDTEGEMGLLLRLDLENSHEAYIVQFNGFQSQPPFADFFADLSCIFTLFFSCDEEQEEIVSYSDLSFMYGIRRQKMTYAAGLGYLKSSNNLDSSQDDSRLGLVLNARRNGKILDLLAHVNINEKNSYLMIGLTYEIDL